MQIKIIHLSNPYHLLEDKQARDLFGKLMEMKIFAYRRHYTDKVIPFSKDDYIADYAFICNEDDNGELTPLWTYKYLSYDRCQEFGLTFPPFEYLEDGYSEHLPRFKAEIEEAVKQNRTIGYIGGMIRNQRFTNEQLPEDLKVYGFGVFTKMVKHLGWQDIYAIATIRNHSSQLTTAAGFKHFIEEPIQLHAFDHVDAYFDKANVEELSERSLFCEKVISKTWEQRSELIGVDVLKKKAA